VRNIVTSWLVLALASASMSAGAATVSPKHYDLPDHGELLISVPDTWNARWASPKPGMPPGVWLSQQSGASFNVLITPISASSTSGVIPDDARIRAIVSSAAQHAESQSVEQSLVLETFVGQHGRGYYFFATDRAPAPGEWKYLTEGMMRIGPIVLTFTILTNDGQEPIVKAALEMLRQAAYQQADGV
jgi:hypothetical protein